MFRTAHRTASRALATALLVVTAFQPAAGSDAHSLGRVDVYDRDDRQALETYRHDGKRYVIGTPGHEYAVRIRNCTGGRLLAVVSVDGVNAVTGETASPDQSGYVIEPGGYVNIQGWRKDLERTAAFTFRSGRLLCVAHRPARRPRCDRGCVFPRTRAAGTLRLRESRPWGRIERGRHSQARRRGTTRTVDRASSVDGCASRHGTRPAGAFAGRAG